MSDLISREKVIDVIHKKIQNTSDYLQHDALIDVEFEVAELPTVEAKEVVHAKWSHIGGDEWCCTECGYVISTEGSWEKPIAKFCEECGASMRTSAE